jgi:nucleoside-diphosphate kinase
MYQRSLGIIKPDAVKKNVIGKIISIIEENGIKISGLKMVTMTRKQAEGFYYVHKDKPFFSSLIDFMTSGPVVLMLLEGEDVIVKWRNLMGATNPENADEGTIRKLFATDIEKNAVHGSDAVETADFETRYFFNAFETNER